MIKLQNSKIKLEISEKGAEMQSTVSDARKI